MDWDDESLSPDDMEALAEAIFVQLKLNERQRKFVLSRHGGSTQSEAARVAGYPEDGKGNWHIVGSKTAKSQKIKNALAKLAELRNAQTVDEIGNSDELHALIWKIARTDAGANQVRAAELLNRIDAAKPAPSEADILAGVVAEVERNPRLWIVLSAAGMIDTPAPETVAEYLDKNPRLAVAVEQVAHMTRPAAKMNGGAP